MIYDILWDVQKQGVDLIDKQPLRLLADEPGSGKTLQALAAVEKRGGFEPGHTTLILAPKDPCRITWMPHIQRHVPEDVVVVDAFSGTGTARDKRLAALHGIIGDPPVIIVANHEAIRIPPGGKPFLPALFELTFTAVVIDEAHLVLPTTTDNYNRMTQFWKGLTKLRIAPGALRLPMTGTPDRSKLHYRYGTLKFLFPQAHTNYEAWVRDFFHMNEQRIVYPSKFKKRADGRPEMVEKYIEVPGALKDPARWKALDDLYLIRRTKNEIRAGRPQKLHIPVVLPMTGKQRAEYFEMERAHRQSEGNPAVYALRARQMASARRHVADNIEDTNWAPMRIKDGGESNHLDWLLTWLQERGHMDPDYQIDPENPSKVVITSFLNENLEWLAEELAEHGIKAPIMKGGQGALNQRIQADFQDFASPTRVVLLQQRLGVGIDLDAADDMIFFDVPHNSDDTNQIEDRIDRLSRDHRMTIWWLLSESTYEIAVALENIDRFETTRSALDGARGIDYARKMLGDIRRKENR